jgi:sterol desaturase/sphingolipid hydroxylase (fatty acid hydroxylase superfamily)
VGWSDRAVSIRWDTVESMSTARELTTLDGVRRAFVASSSPRVIAVSMLGAAVARTRFGALTWFDVAVVVGVAVAVGPVEWVIHRTLLHAPQGRWISELLGTRDSHERHHREPDDLEWLLLRRPNAIGSCVAIIGPAVLIASGVATGLGDLGDGTAWAAAATGVFVALLALLHYEWVHLLVHSRYQPTSAYYRRLDRHHRLHHFRNERYWLGVTSNSGDRLLGTLPANRSSVPLSATARSLDTSLR